MTDAPCALAGQMGGAIHLSLNFLLHFLFQDKKWNRKLNNLPTNSQIYNTSNSNSIKYDISSPPAKELEGAFRR